MKLATLGQKLKMVRLVGQKKVTAERLQELLTSGLLADLLEGEPGAVNRQTFRWAIRLNRFSIWQTITLKGHYNDVNVFRQQMEETARPFRLDADKFMKRTSFKGRPMDIEVDLVLVSGLDLGFEKEEGIEPGYTFKRAAVFGLEVCPPDLGHELQRQYKGPPFKRFIHVAMECISSDGYPGLSRLYLENRDSGLELFLDAAGYARDAARRWVFIQPRKE